MLLLIVGPASNKVGEINCVQCQEYSFKICNLGFKESAISGLRFICSQISFLVLYPLLEAISQRRDFNLPILHIRTYTYNKARRRCPGTRGRFYGLGLGFIVPMTAMQYKNDIPAVAGAYTV